MEAETRTCCLLDVLSFKCFKSLDLGLRLYFLFSFLFRFPKSTTLDYFLMSAGICLSLPSVESFLHR